MFLWDSAGQMQYVDIKRQLYKKFDALLLIFDLAQLSSFQFMTRWVSEFHQSIGVDNFIMYLVGNKVNLDDVRKVKAEDA